MLIWLTAASLFLFVGSLLAVPALVVRIPADYFAQEKRPPSAWEGRHPAVRLGLLIGRNVLGCALIAAGIAMLALPGQGLLTILAGFLLLDFPGKYRLEKRLLSRRRILSSINWLRKRKGREPLRVEP